MSLSGTVFNVAGQYGMLTGKFSRASQFSSGDHRTWRWEPEEFSKKLGQVEALKEAFEGKTFNLAQLAIGFALSHPDVSVVICGAKRPSQIEDNVAASEFIGKAIGEEELQKARDLITSV
jgi:aryl-alcohol dehydrogenase-like predicted oxidoreductase